MKRYVNATISRRLGAFILDLCTIILGATIVFLITIQLFSKTTLMKEANEIINKIQIDSHLYVYDDDNMTMVIEEKDYAVAIKDYYYDYKKDEETYHNKMIESNLFDFVDGNYLAKSDVTEEQVNDFYSEMMGEAILEIKNNEDYDRCSDIIINCQFYSLVISILISYIIFIIVIPLLRKNKNTIGQRVLNLSLVDKETNEKISNIQLTFRAIIILIIEGFIALNSFGIPIILSMGMIVFRKDRCSYHDLFSNVKMIDYHYVEIDDTRNNGNN